MLIFYILTIWALRAQANKIDIVYPVHQQINSTAYEFVPMATIIGFSFTGICFFLLVFAKIMFTSSDQNMSKNRYDLVIFKPATRNSNLGLRRVYKNLKASNHNLNAAAASGFNVSMLINRNSYNSIISLSDSGDQVARN